MAFGGASSLRAYNAPVPHDVLDDGSIDRDRLVCRLQQWQWLDELRNRSELAIEVLDTRLDCILNVGPQVHTAVTLRGLLRSDNHGRLRRAAAAVLRTAAPRLVAAAGLRIRLVPLFARPAAQSGPIGVLLVADLDPAGAGSGDLDGVDRRLDATGQWLAAALENAITASAREFDDARTIERLAAVVDTIDALSRSDCERDILSLSMEALALWYDADVRLYRCDLADAFVLDSSLPGAAACDAAIRLCGAPISPRQEVFRLDSMDDALAIGWTGPVDTLFVPLNIEDSTEWLLTVSGGGDPTLAVTLGLFSRTVSLRLTHLQRESAERLRMQVRAALTFGDAPFDATVRLALELIARETGALSAQIATFPAQLATHPGAHDRPVLVVGWACADDETPPFTEPGTTITASHRITTGVAAGSGLTAVLALSAEGPGFSSRAVGLAQAAAELLGVWLSGAMVQPRDLRVAAESEYATSFAERLTGYVDKFGRLTLGGAVAVVLPHGGNGGGVEVDEVIQVVQEQVRSSDVVGIVGNGAGVFVPQASREAAAALVQRLMLGIERKSAMAVRVGITTFAPCAESPEALLQRARSNAHREASAS